MKLVITANTGAVKGHVVAWYDREVSPETMTLEIGHQDNPTIVADADYRGKFYMELSQGEWRLEAYKFSPVGRWNQARYESASAILTEWAPKMAQWVAQIPA